MGASLKAIDLARVFSVLRLLSVVLLSIIPFLYLIAGDGYFAIGDYVFPLFPGRELVRCVNIWDESFLMGRLNTPIPLANFPQYVLYYVLALLLGMDGASRAIFPLVFIVMGFSIYSLSRYLTGGFLPSLVSVVIYIYNPWIINRILSGHLSLLFAYALTPLMLTLYFKGVDMRSFKWATIASLPLALIISLSYHLASLVIPIVFIYPLFKMGLRNVKDLLSSYKLVATMFLLSLLLNSYWITSAFIVMSSGGVKGTNIIDIGNLSRESSIVNVLRLHGYFWLGWWSIFRSSLPEILIHLWWVVSFLPVTLSLLAVVVYRDSKVKLMFISIVIYSVLAVGLGWPFSFLNRLLYENVPFYTIYRDPNKMVGVLCLAYTILSAYSVRWILRFRRGRIIIVAVVLCLLFNAWPLLTGNLYGYVEPLNLPRDYFEVDQWLQNQTGDFRVLWLPPIEVGAEFTWRPKKEGIWGILDPLKYSVLSKPSVGFTQINEWFGGVERTVWFLHFLYNQIYRGKLKELTPLLGMLNVRYIVFRGDVAADSCSERSKDWNDFRRIEEALNSVFRVVYRVGYLKVYENPLYSMGCLNVAYDSLVVVGDLEALTILPQIQDVRQKAVFFIDDLNLNDLYRVLNSSNSVTFTFLDTSLIDAALTLLKDKYTLSNYAKGYWVPVVYEWRKDNLHAIVERGCLHRGLLYSSTPKSAITIPLNIRESNVYGLWVKAWLDSKPGVVEFYLDGFMVANISLYSSSPTFKYILVSSIYLPAGSHNLEVVLRSGEAILGDLVLVESSQLDQVLKNLENIISNPRVAIVSIHTSDTLRGILAKPIGTRKPLEILLYGEVKTSTRIYSSGLYNVTVKAKGVVHSAKIEFNNTVYRVNIGSSCLTSLVNVDSGLYELKIYIKGNASVDYVAIVKQSSVEAKGLHTPQFVKESVLKYNVKGLGGNCILVFKQSYNPLWLAYGKNVYSSIPTLSVFNAYPIPQEENIVLKLKLEDNYTLGMFLSLVSLTVVLTITFKDSVKRFRNINY